MKYVHSEIGQFGHRFQVHLSREEVTSIRQQVIHDITKLQKNLSQVKDIENHLADKISETAREKILFEAFSQILNDHRLAPCAPVKFSAPPLPLEGGYDFTGEFEIKPTIRALNTEGVLFNPIPTPIEASALHREVHRMLLPYATARDVRPEDKAQPGSFVLFNISYGLQGIPLSDANGQPHKGDQNRGLIIGQNSYRLPIDDFFIGMRAGESKKFEYQMPQVFNIHEIAGKKAEIEIEVLKVQELLVPELTDAFVIKQFGGRPGAPKNAEEFRSFVRTQLENRLSFEHFNQQKGATLLKLIELNPFPIPVSMLAAQKKALLAYYEKQAQLHGKWRAPLPDSPMDRKVTLDAANIVRAGIIIEFLSEKHGLRVSAQDIEAHLQKTAQLFGTTADVLKSKLTTEDSKNQMTYTILENKVVDLFKKSA